MLFLHGTEKCRNYQLWQESETPEETDTCVYSLLSCSDEKRTQSSNCQQKSKRFTAFPVLLSH